MLYIKNILKYSFKNIFKSYFNQFLIIFTMIKLIDINWITFYYYYFQPENSKNQWYISHVFAYFCNIITDCYVSFVYVKYETKAPI